MSYKGYFIFAQGLSKTIQVPIGTKEKIDNHVKWIESTLNIEREKYLDNPERWKFNDYKNISNEVLCNSAEKHNNWVRDIYDLFQKCSKTPLVEFEDITPEEAQLFFPALQIITVKPERWTGEYYTSRMETIYSVMRGNEEEGITFDALKLTIKQAEQVIILFSEFLDNDDRCLMVPKGQDYLASNYDGGYEWCEKCGAITYEDSLDCEKRGCPLLKQYKEEQKDNE
jgi:hypothetical protein